ncbi:RNA-directed DNA polymerase from mobile element jockey-like [Brachionus plicatilis]|uniref:RNA-directed DNA polymerase from mobile element jockey-like n=1 Tax=Brachionus plicatilis TaxID=10195 RepID=A0A3M7SKG6_BRAPC|nr:RNA-directed DNA polymerase from mobile element jockey-like [Brachionus plicatilis]
MYSQNMRENKLQKAWKSPNITMISKKSFLAQKPINYRKISMTSCLGKLLERFNRYIIDIF